MNVHEAIEARRAYRSLGAAEVGDDLIRDLARHAQLAPSCNNNQPWRFVFVRDPGVLTGLHEALNSGNAWMKAAPMLIAVCGRVEDDCVIKDREYLLFGLGLATAFLVLRATELGLVAHPVAGFSPAKTRAALGIPEDHKVITVIAVGRKADALNPVLSPNQIRQEAERPERLPLDRFVFLDGFGRGLPGGSAGNGAGA
ncbi:MAG: nitroreductase family protein [Acidobacteriota bacterium]|nr:nitroreductase family protein [Acidobacteriota bacterium]